MVIALEFGFRIVVMGWSRGGLGVVTGWPWSGPAFSHGRLGLEALTRARGRALGCKPLRAASVGLNAHSPASHLLDRQQRGTLNGKMGAGGRSSVISLRARAQDGDGSILCMHTQAFGTVRSWPRWNRQELAAMATVPWPRVLLGRGAP